jgi:MATE family multidrug resistance protein
MRRPGLLALLGLSWPIMVSRSTQVVVGLSDALLVADLGKAALAATTTGSLNAFAVLVFFMGTVFIVSSFASQLCGKGDLVGARRYAFYGLAIAAATQIACLVAQPFVPWIVERLDFEPAVRSLMSDYLVVRLWSGGAAIGLEALANYYGGLSRPRLPMIASISAMVLNVLGNWALIHGRWGAPAMGVKGSALASTLATSVAFAGLLLVFAWEGRGFERPRLKWSEFVRVLRFGLPSGFNWCLEFFAYNFWVNVVMVGLGTTAVAAMMAVMQLNSTSFMPAFGMASGGAILVGQAIGADQRDQVPSVVKLTFSAAAVWQGIVGLAYVFMPRMLLSPLAPADDRSAFLQVGTRILVLSAAWQLFDAAVNTTGEALRAAGDTTFLLAARVAVAWLIFVPGSYVSVRVWHWGPLGAASWLMAYLVLLAVLLYLRFRGGAWRSLQLVEATLEG